MRKDRMAKERACKLCGCTAATACIGGCAWSEEDPEVCTVCEAARLALARWFVHAWSPRAAEMFRESKFQAAIWPLGPGAAKAKLAIMRPRVM